MIEQFFAPQNLPFAVALTIMLILGLVEGMGMIIGLGVSDLLDSLLPDMDVDADVDLDIDIDSPDLSGGHGVEVGHLDQIGPFTRMLSWLRVGRVPILILMVIFLLSFGLGGLILQAVIASFVGEPLPTIVAVVPALLVAIWSMNVLGGLAQKIVPRDESSAVSQDSFVGHVAVITTGAAETGKPAQARLRDKYQQAHYLMVEPDIEGEVLGEGEEVLIVRKEGSAFRAIANPNPALTDSAST